MQCGWFGSVLIWNCALKRSSTYIELTALNASKQQLFWSTECSECEQNERTNERTKKRRAHTIVARKSNRAQDKRRKQTRHRDRTWKTKLKFGLNSALFHTDMVDNISLSLSHTHNISITFSSDRCLSSHFAIRDYVSTN